MINVGIAGATGYTGVTLLRILLSHPMANIKVLTSRREAGKSVADLFPIFRTRLNLDFQPFSTEAFEGCNLVFFATPSGVAMHQTEALLEKGIKVIDLSSDFRFKDPMEWQQWHGQPHSSPHLLPEAVYGLSELNRDLIGSANLVANPGCYATAVQLGFLPLLQKGLVDSESLIADVKSGISGAGRQTAMNTQFCESADAFSAYSAAGHRHHPEIIQTLSSLHSAETKLVFIPHLTPLIRGIHATLYAKLEAELEDIQAAFEGRYGREPFVDAMPPGSHPNTNSVRDSNMVRIASHRATDSDTLIILVVEDNLYKGAAGQAVQNMNIMFNFDETLGLQQCASFP